MCVLVSAFKLVRKSSRSHDWWGCEVLLFVVRQDYQGRGIGKRQLEAIHKHCVDQRVPQLVVLSAQPPGDENWWLHVSPTTGGTAMQGAAVVDSLYDIDLPAETFLLPWQLIPGRYAVLTMLPAMHVYGCDGAVVCLDRW